MTREEILKEYKVEGGYIKSPGKFEGERVYVPFYWGIYLQGAHDGETKSGSLKFVICSEDIEEFPELAEDGFDVNDPLYICQSIAGFVLLVTEETEIDPKEWAEVIAIRIADEWTGKAGDPETAELLEQVLIKALKAVPEETMKLVGTGIIEENYFTAAWGKED